MDAVVSNPPAENSGNNLSLMIGIILILAIVLALVYFALPNIDTSLNTPQVNVPGQVDVNINDKTQ